jgi:hypothetical protein
MRTVQEIAQDVATQDNAITELPIFVVQQRHRTYGIEPRYTDDSVWMSDGDDPHEADAETAAKLDELRKTSDYDDEIFLGDDGEETKWIRVGFRDHWEFVTACFTRVGCEDYLRVNGHNLTDPRIYVESGYRNQEWETMRKHLLGMVGVEQVEPLSETRLHAKAMVAIMKWIEYRTGKTNQDELVFSVMNMLSQSFKKEST